MASLRTQHLNRDGNKERDVHIWGTVFPAEGTVKALRHECIRHAQETERGQTGRVRHRVGGIGVAEAAGNQTVEGQ